MKSIEFNVRVITPMFMAGADRNTPELRPSEFKGMMRFWWRAARAENDIKKLKKEEAEIFGGTGVGEGRSNLRLAFDRHVPNEDWIGFNISDELNEKLGCKYLFYSTFLLRSRGKPIIRKYIKSKYRFNLKLSILNEQFFDKILSSFWLAIYLGGFGTRSRRGGGNIAIEGIEGDLKNVELSFLTPKTTKIEELGEWIKENLKFIKLSIRTQNTSQYPNLSNSRILIFPSKEDWADSLDALNWVGEKFKFFRKRHKADLWNMSAFGMPIMHNRFSIRMIPYNNAKRRLSERLASPLIIKVIEVNSLFFPMLIKLNYNIGDVGKEIRANREWHYANKGDVKKVDMKKIDEFFDELKKQTQTMEIEYDKL